MAISNHVVMVEDGYYKDVTTNIVYSSNLTLIQIDEVPQDIIPNKYCYTAEKGFYISPTYQFNLNLKDTVDKLQLELAESKAK